MFNNILVYFEFFNYYTFYYLMWFTCIYYMLHWFSDRTPLKLEKITKILKEWVRYFLELKNNTLTDVWQCLILYIIYKKFIGIILLIYDLVWTEFIFYICMVWTAWAYFFFFVKLQVGLTVKQNEYLTINK